MQVPQRQEASGPAHTGDTMPLNESIFSLKCFAFPTIQPVVSWKNAFFTLTSGRAVLCCRIFGAAERPRPTYQRPQKTNENCRLGAGRFVCVPTNAALYWRRFNLLHGRIKRCISNNHIKIRKYCLFLIFFEFLPGNKPIRHLTIL